MAEYLASIFGTEKDKVCERKHISYNLDRLVAIFFVSEVC